MAMIHNTKIKVFLGLLITVLILVLVQYLTVRNTSFFVYVGQLVRNVTARYNNSTIFWKPQTTNISKIRASTNDMVAMSLEKDKIRFHHQNVNTSFKSPRKDISRNVKNCYSKYRQLQQVPNFKELYDPRFCVVELEVDRKTNTSTAGTELTVRIHLYNGYNQSLTQGGDLLNIWLTTEDRKSSVAGYVVDNMNGTYTGHVMAFWAGNVLLKVSVTNTKEGIGLYIYYMNVHGSYHFTNATFIEKKKREMTQCAPVMSDWLNKTYGGFCNLTHENYNISLFCGKPKSVSCRKWVKYGWDDSLYCDESTRKILGYKDVLLKEIKVTIAPSSKGDLDYPLPSTTCNLLPRASTWNSTVPSGFLYRGVYHNLMCRPTIQRSMENYRACLKDRPIISIGDSTTRQWFSGLTHFLQIKHTEGFTNDNAWQKFAQAYNKTLGLDMEWQPHELPFHGTPGSNRKNTKSVAYRIDRIPANSTAIVILHWYGHIARCCDHIAFREHVLNAKAAIMRLLARSPDVQIFIKGPHLLTHHNDMIPYAYVKLFVVQVLREEFTAILDRIIYLDQWDMSMATENVNIHPDQLLVDTSLNNFINFACLDR